MIIEIADFRVAADQQHEFAQALQRGVATVLSKAQGYRAHRILSCIESPERLVLMVEWDTLEDHTVGFRQSAAFADWRAIIGPYFLSPPVVEHFTQSAA